MRVSATAPATQRWAEHVRPQAVPAAGQPLPPIPLPGDADQNRARYDAQILLESIDWSKSDIVIWVPGTSNHTMHPAFESAARDAWKGQASIVKMDYEASNEFRRSVSTGVETLRLVLAGIAARGGNHKVYLAGESQGAWVIGEAMSDTVRARIVKRAVLLGHPAVARTQYPDGSDRRILRINHKGDLVATPVRGSVDTAIDGMSAIQTKNIAKLGTIIKATSANPGHLGRMLLGGLRWLTGDWIADPHNYSADMTRAVEFLLTSGDHRAAVSPQSLAA